MNKLEELEDILNFKLSRMTEEKLFNLLKRTVLKSLKRVDNQFSKHDCIINNGAVELKCRRTHYSTLRLQKDKFDHMQQFNIKYYVCSTTMGIYLFDLDRLNPEWSLTNNPVSTDFSNKNMILKMTYDIPLLDGVNITSKILKCLKTNI